MNMNNLSAKQKFFTQLFVMVLLLGLGIVIGEALNRRATKLKINKVAAQAHPVRGGAEGYKFINPLLGYDTAKATEFGEYEDLQSMLEKKQNEVISNNSVDKFSVYFRDLPRGRWLGVNEDAQYSPASLLKVPLMIIYFKLSESNPDILNKQIKYNGGSNVGRVETITGSQALQVGQTYTIDQLITYMIVYSDNNALDLLYSNMDPATLSKFFSDFGILVPDVVGAPQDFISPKTYALFFRVLYGSTYLSRFDSEKSLDLLSKVEYKNGLVAGVPSNVAVSHKFGEYGVVIDNQSIREFHDCGIVYYPNHPYLLCIMTKGADIEKLQRVIKETSQLIYDEMKNMYH